MTDLDTFKLPRVNAINRYISAYISGLNQHIPFLHLPTLDLNELEVPRLLAMCSLGALYCFEKEHARRLHVASMLFLQNVGIPPFSAWLLSFFRRNLFSWDLLFLILLCSISSIHFSPSQLFHSSVIPPNIPRKHFRISTRIVPRHPFSSNPLISLCFFPSHSLTISSLCYPLIRLAILCGDWW